MVICGTGHRPNKLGGYSSDVFKRLVSVATWGLWEHGKPYPTVISGGALGWDQALAEAALNKHYPLHLYLPFRGFDARWPQESKDRLVRIAIDAQEYDGNVKFISEEGYAPWKMQKRNEAMVDASDLVLALWDGSSGGTANCIRYAEKVGKPVINLWNKYCESLSS